MTFLRSILFLIISFMIHTCITKIINVCVNTDLSDSALSDNTVLPRGWTLVEYCKIFFNINTILYLILWNFFPFFVGYLCLGILYLKFYVYLTCISSYIFFSTSKNLFPDFRYSFFIVLLRSWLFILLILLLNVNHQPKLSCNVCLLS